MEKNKFDFEQFKQVIDLKKNENIMLQLRIDLTAKIFDEMMQTFSERCLLNVWDWESFKNVLSNTQSEWGDLWEIARERAVFILKMAEEMRNSQKT